MKKLITVTMLASCLLAGANVSQASMRCGNNLINEGDNKFEVIQKCGEPDKRETFDPLIGSDNKPANKSVSVENWMYGPSNGMNRYLKFIDGILVKIESRRQ